MAEAATRRLFVYGTLMDEDVRRLLLGRDANVLTVRPARLDGYRRVAAPGAPYPILLPDPDARTEGCLIGDLASGTLRRIGRYEGSEYRLAACTVRADGRDWPARVFVARGASRDGGEWSFAAWRRRHKPALLRELRRA